MKSSKSFLVQQLVEDPGSHEVEGRYHQYIEWLDACQQTRGTVPKDHLLVREKMSAQAFLEDSLDIILTRKLKISKHFFLSKRA